MPAPKFPYVMGEFRVICDRCGQNFHNVHLRKEWTGLMTCHGPMTNNCWELRNAQDYVRGVRDKQSPPWTRPKPDSVFSSAIITGATQADPVVITTSAAHGFANGETVWIRDVNGMTQINKRSFTTANVASTTFELSGEDGLANFLDFDGTTSDYVIASTMAGFPTTAITVEVWVKSDGTNIKKGTPFSYAVSGTDDEFVIFNYNDLTIFIDGNQRSSSVSVNDGEWHHIAVTWENSAGEVILYVDGSNVYSSTGYKVGSVLTDGGTVVLGQEQDNVGGGFTANQAFLGQMTDVRLWDDVRTPAEIAANYQTRLGGTEAGLVSYWRLNEGSGTNADDSSAAGNDNDGTINGTSWGGVAGPQDQGAFVADDTDNTSSDQKAMASVDVTEASL